MNLLSGYGLVQENPFALSIGDLMAALLLVFVLLVCATLLLVKEDEQSIQDIAAEYESLQDSLYMDLYNAFQYKLEEWAATIERETLTIRFEEPDVLFTRGASTVRPVFEEILDDFFPRYIAILTKRAYRDSIEEIRIEGHTSTDWAYGATEEESYFANMRLSQDRTRSVLRYALSTMPDSAAVEWTRARLTANGLSSSKPILTSDGSEDQRLSRRVEFRVRTDAERRLKNLFDKLVSRRNP